jgi:4-diphosphocytidyl-2-C-methyl-D-erythritol kinase
MLSFPNCKINLGLYITEKRSDGYHNLETVFYPVALRDALEVIPSAETRLHLSGGYVGGNAANNLVMKAYNLLHSQYPEKLPPLDIYLHKAIPMGAGLGGGSADGAFMLSLLDEYCHLSLGREELAGFALQLGSDCPFFIYNSPQFAKGRGEQMQALNLDLSSYCIQLICPDLHISTAKAFSMIQPKLSSFDLRELPKLPIAEWKELLSNDFEAPVFAEYPELAAIKAQLYQQGAIYAAMSGSGSALYGLFHKGEKAKIATTLTVKEHYLPL